MIKNHKKIFKKTNIKKANLKILLRGLKKEAHNHKLPNKEYFKIKESLFKKLNLRPNTTENKSDIISRPEDSLDSSIRMNLYLNYDVFQIVLMNKVIKNFQKRLLNANFLNIQLMDDSRTVFEEIFIESPVEIYRFCIKLLKKEMKELKINHLFKGKSPSFNDLIASAYETQIIDKTFLEELYKIQEFWSPKKTKWEKNKVLGFHTYPGGDNLLTTTLQLPSHLRYPCNREPPPRG